MKTYLALLGFIGICESAACGQTIVSSVPIGQLPNNGTVTVQDNGGISFLENIDYNYGISLGSSSTTFAYTLPASVTATNASVPVLASTSYLYNPFSLDVPFPPESGSPNDGSNYDASGTYSLGTGVFFTSGIASAPPSSATSLSNPANQTISSTVTGLGRALSFGIYSLTGINPANGSGLAHSIYNGGNIQSAVQNYNGEAIGVLAKCNNGGVSFLNDFGANITTSASNMSSGVYIGAQYYETGTPPINAVNRGTITGHAYGGQTPEAWGYSYGIWAAANGTMPIYMENDGTITSDTTSTNWSHYQDSCGVIGWANSAGFTLINTGTITAKSDHNKTLTTAGGSTISSNYSCRGTYIGCGGGPSGTSGGPLYVYNSGTINSVESWALGLEQDCNFPTTVNNNGTITCTYGAGMFLYNSFGTAPLTVNNYGTVSGGGFCTIGAYGYESNVTINDSGNILNPNGGEAMVLPWTNGPLCNNTVNTVTLTGLPTIQGNIDGGVGTTTLNFQVTGTLEKVNGVTATLGNNLAAYNLGGTATPSYVLDSSGNKVTFIEENGATAYQTVKNYPASASGSIQVSGKVYTFSRMSHVVGTVSGIQSGHVYKLTNANSGKVLGIDSESLANGANAIQYEDNGTPDHNWTVTLLSDGYYKLTNANSGKLLGIANMSTTAGANALQWDDNGTLDHEWLLTQQSDGNFKLTNHNSGELLGITGMSTTNGAIALQWPDNGTLDHEWALDFVQ